MWKYFKNVHCIASSEIKYATYIDDVVKINEEFFISEYFGSGLSLTIYLQCTCI
jgi:hypothetical protein